MAHLIIIDRDGTAIGEIVEAHIGGFMWKEHWNGCRLKSGAKRICGSISPNKNLEAVKKSAIRSLGEISFENRKI